MFCKKSLIVIGVALTLLCGTSVAMDHSQAGSSAVGASSTLAENSEKWVVVTCSNNETFTLNFDEIKELPLFKNRDYLNEALIRGVSLPFELATGAIGVFKTILKLTESENVATFLHKQSVVCLIELAKLFDFFCAKNRVDIIINVLAFKLSDSDFLHNYNGQELLPLVLAQKVRDRLLTAPWFLANDHTQMLTGHRDWVKDIAITADGMFALTGSLDGTARLWHVPTGACVQTLIGHTDSISCVAVTTDGQRAVTGSWDHDVRVWDLRTGVCLHTLSGHKDAITCLAITPDNQCVVAGSRGDTVRVWDLATGAYVRCFDRVGGWVNCLVVTADRRFVIVANDVHVWLLNLATGENIGQFCDHLDYIRCVAVTPNRRFVVAGAVDHLVRVHDCATGVTRKLIGHTNRVTSIAVTSDSTRAVTGSDDCTARIWDLATGICQHVLDGHTDYVVCVALTHDNAFAITGSADTTVRIWDINSGACVQTLNGHTASVKCAAVTPDGKFLITGAADNNVRIWGLVWCQSTLEQLLLVMKRSQTAQACARRGGWWRDVGKAWVLAMLVVASQYH